MASPGHDLYKSLKDEYEGPGAVNRLQDFNSMVILSIGYEDGADVNFSKTLTGTVRVRARDGVCEHPTRRAASTGPQKPSQAKLDEVRANAQRAFEDPSFGGSSAYLIRRGSTGSRGSI